MSSVRRATRVALLQARGQRPAGGVLLGRLADAHVPGQAAAAGAARAAATTPTASSAAPRHRVGAKGFSFPQSCGGRTAVAWPPQPACACVGGGVCDVLIARRSPTCCCWTSPPTTLTLTRSSGWKSTCAGRRCPWWWSRMTASSSTTCVARCSSPQMPCSAAHAAGPWGWQPSGAWAGKCGDGGQGLVRGAGRAPVGAHPLAGSSAKQAVG